MSWFSRSSSASVPWKIALAGLWLAVTLAFAIWWFWLSLSHLGQLKRLEPQRLDHWQRQERMVFWEGTGWLVLLALGGGSLIVLAYNERQRVRRIREFFASFSHEIKTSLASLRLQAESLKDDATAVESPVLDRLIADTVRLQVQLENSLFFASQDSLSLFIQPVVLSDLLDRLQEQWPIIRIHRLGDAEFLADERALRTILGNIVQNAIVHGKANQVEFAVQESGNDRVRLNIRDDGRGFAGDVRSLGRLFDRPTASSGSGLGLFISRFLIEKMGGIFTVLSPDRGFSVEIDLPGGTL